MVSVVMWFKCFCYFSETYACDVHFEKIGCYNDYSRNNELALTARDHRSSKYMGEPIDWWNYDIFLPKFACECAKKVLEKGYNTFGLQYYGMLNALDHALIESN